MGGPRNSMPEPIRCWPPWCTLPNPALHLTAPPTGFDAASPCGGAAGELYVRRRRPTMVETATYAVPDLKLSMCPWCKRSTEKYHLLVYDRKGVTQFEVMCDRCQAAALQF